MAKLEKKFNSLDEALFEVKRAIQRNKLGDLRRINRQLKKVYNNLQWENSYMQLVVSSNLKFGYICYNSDCDHTSQAGEGTSVITFKREGKIINVTIDF